MYVVVLKGTRNIIHVNRAPPSQNLSGSSVYHDFDPDKHDIGVTDLSVLPAYWSIDAAGVILDNTLEEAVQKGLVERKKGFKPVGDRWIPLTDNESVVFGDRILAEDEKFEGSTIVKKTVFDLYEDGLIDKASFIESVSEMYELAVQNHIDSKARELGFDSIISAVSYVGDDNPQWDAEARALKSWRSSVWAAVNTLYAGAMDAVVIPSESEFIDMLPPFQAV